MQDYKPPPREELQRLKEELGFTNAEMAALFGISEGGQFHKYTSNKDPREMGFHVLMYGMLGLSLLRGIRVMKIEQLHEMGRSYGAVIPIDRAGAQQP